MEQNTSKWLEWRRGGIGSSDAPVILGLSKYMTPIQLFEEKLGLSSQARKSTFIQELGHKFEPQMRQTLNFDYDLNLEPALITSASNDRLRASLDGLDFENKIFCEIKMVGKDRLDRLKKLSVPDSDHYAQIQHQFLVTGFERCLYGAYVLNPEKNGIVESFSIEIRPDHAFIENLLGLELEFLECLKSGVPPAPIARDTKSVSGHELDTKQRDYLAACEEFEKAEDRKRQLYDELVSLMRDDLHSEVVGRFLSLKKVIRKGAIDYSLIEALRGIDLGQFRKPPTVYYQLRPIKAKE